MGRVATIYGFSSGILQVQPNNNRLIYLAYAYFLSFVGLVVLVFVFLLIGIVTILISPLTLVFVVALSIFLGVEFVLLLSPFKDCLLGCCIQLLYKKVTSCGRDLILHHYT